MSVNIFHSFISTVNEIQLDRNEENVFAQFQQCVNHGTSQMQDIKEKLINVNNDIDDLSLTIYNTINEESSKLQKLLADFNAVYKSVLLINENAISIGQKCEKRSDELNIHQSFIESCLKSTEKSLLEKENEYLQAELQYEESFHNLEQAKTAQTDVRDQLRELSFQANVAGAIACSSVTIAAIFFSPIYIAIPIACYCYHAYKDGYKYFAKGYQIPLEANFEKCVALKEFALEEVEREKAAKNRLTKELESTKIEYENVKKENKNQTKKVKSFERMIKLLCNFQITFKKWQQPLDQVINVYETHVISPSNLPRTVQKDQKLLTEKIKCIIAGVVYSELEFASSKSY